MNALNKGILLGLLSVSALIGCGGGDSSAPVANSTSGGASATTTAPVTGDGSGTTGGTGTTSSADTSTSASCYNSALWTTGTTYQIDLQTKSNGSTVLASTNKYKVNGSMAFKGVNAVELNIDTTVTSGAGAGTVNNNKSYGNLTSDKFEYYGLVNTITAAGMTFVTTASFTPPMITPLNMNVNQSYTNSTTMKTDMSPPTSVIPDVSQTTVITFLGVESVTVAAGTFNACKLKTDTTANGATASSISWTVSDGKYKGLFAKSDDGKGVVSEATKLLVNGS